VKTHSPPRRFYDHLVFSGVEGKDGRILDLVLLSAASRGMADDAPGGLNKSVEPSLVTVAFASASGGPSTIANAVAKSVRDIRGGSKRVM
jgi:hypothetical protein